VNERETSGLPQAATDSSAGRRRTYDGTPFEQTAAYARAVRHGPYIAVSGTIAMDTDGHVAHPQDIHLQTQQAFRKALEAIEELGGTAQDVVRTRMFLTPDSDWRRAASAHAEIFRGIDPANTSLFISGLFVPGALVEVEVDAVIVEPEIEGGRLTDPLRSLIVEVLNEHAATGARGPGGGPVTAAPAAEPSRPPTT
jgi:enamine deaminase RidA (YjgF/YER057c/UK114 family)